MFKILSDQQDFKEYLYDKSNFIQLGVSKIFMKEEVKNLLESNLNKILMNYAIKLQACWRAFKVINKIKKLRRVALLIQKSFNAYVVRKRLIFV
jgi:myosin heavy subunit